MDEKIIFITDQEIGFVRNSKVSYLKSQYLRDFKKNHQAIQERYAWKTQGVNAAFRGDVNPPQTDIEAVLRAATVNGVTFDPEGKVVYSVSVDRYSGLFLKNPENIPDEEGHIIHDTNIQFFNIDCDTQTKEMAAALQNSLYERHIAVFKEQKSGYRLLTEGECIDDNPAWGKGNNRLLFYDSAGIGRDRNGRFMGFSPKVIYRLDLDDNALDEIASLPGQDCFKPKVDAENRLYFIKKPYRSISHKGTSLVDILLIPWKFLRAIYRWIEFFTIRYGGEPLTTNGRNPAKAKQQDPKEILIYGNIVNAEKAMRENRIRGERFPGVAPNSWQLVTLEQDGSLKTIKKGVMDYDIAANGDIIYSNGSYLLRLSPDGREEVITKAHLVHGVRVFH